MAARAIWKRLGPVEAVLLVALLGASEPGFAEPFSIGKWTVDGGGSLVQAGPYSLGGSIGQPDAGLQSRLAYTVIGGFWAPGVPFSVGVEDDPIENAPPAPATIPFVLRVHSAAPNPLLHGTRIAFELPDSRAVEIRIFDLRGALVRTLRNESMSAGRHVVQWDVANSEGSPAGPGLYLVRIRLGDHVTSQKLIVLR